MGQPKIQDCMYTIEMMCIYLYDVCLYLFVYETKITVFELTKHINIDDHTHAVHIKRKVSVSESRHKQKQQHKTQKKAKERIFSPNEKIKVACNRVNWHTSIVYILVGFYSLWPRDYCACIAKLHNFNNSCSSHYIKRSEERKTEKLKMKEKFSFAIVIFLSQHARANTCACVICFASKKPN